MRFRPGTERKDGPKSARRPADAMPRWVKIFCAVGLIMVATVIGLHLAGGGVGHMVHGDADPDAAPAEHGRHQQ